jgi:serine phosphatase RsbU (regulator of sigma subunit)
VDGKLQVFRGNVAGEEYELTAPQVIIGRGDNCGIRLLDPSVSRNHARVVRDHDTYVIEDLGGRNGTFVNDKMLVGSLPLGDGDRIRVTGFTLVFHAAATAVDEGPADDGMTVVGRVSPFGAVARITKASAERQLQAMLQILQALGGTLDLPTLLDAILASLLEVFPQADRGLVLVQENSKLIPKAFRHRYASSDSIAYSRTIVQRALDLQEATLLMDASQENLMSQSIQTSGIRSVMCVPLFSQERQPLGVLQLDACNLRKAFDESDLHVLTCVATQVSMAMEHSQLAHLLGDLRFAAEVQRGFLPEADADFGEYYYWGFCEPARRVGGDFYNFFQLPNGNHAALLGDVAGKGLAASLMMVKAATVCWVALRNHPDDLRGVARWVNREIHHSGNQGQFVTCIFCVICPKTHEITMVSAGHMSPVLCRADGTTYTPISTAMNGLPLGVLEECEYETISVKLEPGECVVLYSDGVSEAEDSSGTMYTSERIGQRLAGLQGRRPPEVGSILMEDLRRYVGDQEQTDDISIVAFGRKESGESEYGSKKA